ncbi:type IV conjugative transfer system protein TraE [Entomohabitans teleogrylli]|uniref:type IV conjugative transfer system protein TraE n=1 Tax=Entomohabitans teleogrylli TaxID=1384589 RepID=UPI00073D7876|nr:type IV conjugative transfer system protein TraE [Entomohabitans teleogrylli]
MELKAHRSAARFTSLIFIILLFLLGLSLTGNIFAWMRIDVLINSKHETYIPMFFDRPVTLSRNQADANYLEQVAESLVFLRYNVSPESVKAMHGSLLRYFDTEQRTTMKEVLDGEAERIIGSNVTSAFYLSGMDTWPDRGVVDIHGTVQTWIGSRKSLPEKKTIRLELKYRRGLTTIQSFEEQVDEKKRN